MSLENIIRSLQNPSQSTSNDDGGNTSTEVTPTEAIDTAIGTGDTGTIAEVVAAVICGVDFNK